MRETIDGCGRWFAGGVAGEAGGNEQALGRLLQQLPRHITLVSDMNEVLSDSGRDVVPPAVVAAVADSKPRLAACIAQDLMRKWLEIWSIGAQVMPPPLVESSDESDSGDEDDDQD